MKAVNKHARIITAATKVFAKKGFFNARISDIAKEAKVADGTIYLYFNNKYDILISVFEGEIGKLIAQAEKILAKENDPQKMLELFATNHLKAMKKNKNLAEVIQVELRQTNKTVKDYRNTTFTQYTDIIGHIIREGQKAGIFNDKIQPDLAKRAFFGALDEISRIWNISLETHYTVDETASQVLHLFLNGLLQPVRAENI
ncbi:TetR/AcrR family transcriptional regulator [Desulfosediminicola ganghwensis]|uniref:TetR/AcrR family transcriptional regulator n=1 Tax=Desulfosediminicola ganghwensis TaxID=2569540 RepID=UPI0010ABD570|nr:TetR/AcrR family transcriptional regulator [Desulfosediminicola ganghwensis]